MKEADSPKSGTRRASCCWRGGGYPNPGDQELYISIAHIDRFSITVFLNELAMEGGQMIKRHLGIEMMLSVKVEIKRSKKERFNR